jgi:L-lactate dehydrogenase (FMN-dependent) and related alpha-hydroxy acid dehydrogenases
MVKGILNAADAVKAIDSGCKAVIISNHGGRSLDTVPASLDVLPAIADQVQQRIPLLLDGGVRRGTDIFKALALGASAVLIGRPYLHGMAVAGPAGVSRVIEILCTEFEMAMGMAGCTSLARLLRAASGAGVTVTASAPAV